MTKPKMKREVAVDYYCEGVLNLIVFYATNDAVTEFTEFGLIEPDGLMQDKYRLTVDARYDFNEVLQCIKNYG